MHVQFICTCVRISTKFPILVGKFPPLVSSLDSVRHVSDETGHWTGRAMQRLSPVRKVLDFPISL